MSDLIRTTRERTGVTGAELAARLGVTPGAVSQMERSERDGTIKLETLDRALAAMGSRLSMRTIPNSPFVEFLPDAVTDQMNAALDERDGSYALRILTHAASIVRQHPEAFSDADLSTRGSNLKDPRWEQLFQAVYGDAIPEARRPAWVAPTRLRRRWYVSRFAPLRERAKRSTPAHLRALNIFLDERSLSTARTAPSTPTPFRRCWTSWFGVSEHGVFAAVSASREERPCCCASPTRHISRSERHGEGPVPREGAGPTPYAADQRFATRRTPATISGT